MKPKTFYGKNFNDLDSDELMLLALDIHLVSLNKRSGVQIPQIAMATKARVILVNKVMNNGGEYSRNQFLEENDFPKDDSPKNDIKEFVNFMDKLMGALEKVIKQDIEEKNEPPINGKEEYGIQMN